MLGSIIPQVTDRRTDGQTDTTHSIGPTEVSPKIPSHQEIQYKSLRKNQSCQILSKKERDTETGLTTSGKFKAKITPMPTNTISHRNLNPSKMQKNSNPLKKFEPETV